MENNYGCAVMVKLQKMRLEQMKQEVVEIEKKMKEWAEYEDIGMVWYYKGQRTQLKAQIGYLEAELKIVEE